MSAWLPRMQWLSARDRLLASRGFQRWALKFPLTRAVARRRAAGLFDLCAGFVYSQILLACVRLRLFTHLERQSRSVAYLSTQLGLTAEATLTLLRAAAALDLVEWRIPEEQCGLGRQGAALLGNPGLLQMIEHHALLYRDLIDPVSLLQGPGEGTQLGGFWAYARSAVPAGTSPDQAMPYTALMSASQAAIADDILESFDFGSRRCLLDVGGGDGTFCVAAAARAPDLRVRCFDLPVVAARAAAKFASAGISGRAVAIGGDFRIDPLPAGSDLITLIRVLHDHDDATVLNLLRAVRRAAGESTTLLIAEPMAGMSEGRRVADAYFGMYLLAMGSGRPRTLGALTRLLRTAGFQAPKLRPTRLPMNLRVLLARPGRANV